MISLLMATARPEAGLMTLLNSLKKQTLDHSQIEFVLVDKAYDQRSKNYLEHMKKFNTDFGGTIVHQRQVSKGSCINFISQKSWC